MTSYRTLKSYINAWNIRFILNDFIRITTFVYHENLTFSNQYNYRRSRIFYANYGFQKYLYDMHNLFLFRT